MVQIINKTTGYVIADGESYVSILQHTKSLCNADLCCADLCNADLRDADLRGADLRDANLCNANLCNADLRDAYLSGANIRYADLCKANLRDADLRDADLRYANLRCADLSGADLSGANLRCANLSGADLSGVHHDNYTSFLAMQCPTDGDFVAWKKVYNCILKLRIPGDAKRSSSTSRKCRASHAEVLEIQNLDGSIYKYKSILNEHYAGAVYTVGEVTYADSWDEDRWKERGHGIHFFITREEAVNY